MPCCFSYVGDCIRIVSEDDCNYISNMCNNYWNFEGKGKKEKLPTNALTRKNGKIKRKWYTIGVEDVYSLH